MIKQFLALFKKQRAQHSPYAAWLRYCKENIKKQEEKTTKKSSNISEATQKDWDDFFLSQEYKPDFIFDR
jgi:membrane-anchored protein YejM (alkaline phosphatase superfamily)